jgi:hypothetical protein
VSDPGFVGAAYQAASLTQDAQDLVNWYPEIDMTKQSGERGVIALYPTPGFFAKVSFNANVEVRAMRVRPGGDKLYVVAGDSLYEINADFTGAKVGTLNTNSGAVSITDNGSSVYIADGVNRYYYTWATGTFAIIADGAFVAGDRVDVIDNFIIYTKVGSNQWGATSAGVVTSSALSFGRKDSAPDNIVACMVNKREVFILGETTSEVWVDAGLFPFPFQKLPGTNMQHGCAAKNSVARLGESFAFLSKDDRGQSVVVQMNGYLPTRISTHAVEVDIQTYSTVADAVGFSYQQSGHEFYVLTFPTADKTWCYDLATGMWHRRARRDSGNVLHRDRANCAVFFQGFNLVGDHENGIIYAASLTAFTDYVDLGGSAGGYIPRIRRCRHLTDDLKHVYHHDLQIQFQPGVGLITGTGDDPQAALKWSDDGGFTWSGPRFAAIGKIGEYKNRCIWRALGRSRDRIYEVTVTDPVYPVIVSANLNTSQGAS